MGKTSIQWTDFSVNPIRARLNGRVGHHCVKVSPGCTNCYASTMQRRFGLPPYEVGKRRNVEVFFDRSKLEQVRRRAGQHEPAEWPAKEADAVVLVRHVRPVWGVGAG